MTTDLSKDSDLPEPRRYFHSLPLGTAFRYIGGDDVWVVLETHGCGLIAKYEHYDSSKPLQQICTFAGSEYATQHTEVDVVPLQAIAAQTAQQRFISDDESTPDFWPIAKLTVADGKINEATFYAPGLPDGEHDVFPVPASLDEHTAAWFAVYSALDQHAPSWRNNEGNAIQAAVKAIADLAAPPTQAIAVEATDSEIDFHLDAVLKAAGSGLKYYSLHKVLSDMRTAMKNAINRAAPSQGANQ